VRKVEDEEVRLLLDPADHDQRLAEIGLGVPGRVVQRHEHLAAAPLMLAQVRLHDGVAAGEPVLVPQAVENPLGRVPLLARTVQVLAQPRVDDLGEPVQLRPLHRRRPPVARRHRVDDHLVDAVARDPEVARDRPFAQALPEVGPPNLPIQLHGENAPALPAVREGKRGRLLRRPPRDHPAATVADFLTAVLMTKRRRRWLQQCTSVHEPSGRWVRVSRS
jgi:hypothetical protein